ncbi:MerR family transcriptional regulator [Halobacillus naozhouensis]|uniref:MerR family transcriptional regulator n=1 Tax=Halobacillus naozhouensis TaxID=554880 RepID=A0ABY8IW36_9BACI|nr:MerR family transcriptional regulator [Halobacillus naozhouensis]WFT74418.1 MerR family transcriptional regulator [Halobacillus naozhouensis]
MPLNDISKIINKISIEQILILHKETLEQKVRQVQESLNHTNTIQNIIRLEGDLHWERLLPIVHLSEQETEQKSHAWTSLFNEEEQSVLRERLPKMEEQETQLWINIIKRIELCLKNNIKADSEEAKLLAEDVLLLSNVLFQGDEALAEKFWRVRKSEHYSQEMGLYPVSDKVTYFMDQALAIHGEGLHK